MKNKITRFLIVLIQVIMFMSAAVFADTGPKPTVTVEFINMGNKICYGTLLYEHESTGPASAWNVEEDDIPQYPEDSMDMKVWRAFTQYKDNDGFFYLQRHWLCSSTKTIDWNYYPPSPFKILLYYPDTDTFAVSDIYERNAFNSKFVADMTDIDTDLPGQTVHFTAKEEYYGEIWETGPMLLRILITIVIEIAAALLFGFRKAYMLVTIISANIITQTGMNIILSLIRVRGNPITAIFLIIITEIIIFITEAVIYNVVFRKKSGDKISVMKTSAYALTANLASFLPGLFIL